MRFFLVYSLAVLVLWSGCSHETSPQEQQAIAIAKQEYARRGGGGTNEFNVNREGNRWIVTVWRIPKVPGGFVTIELSNNWEVISYQRGN